MKKSNLVFLGIIILTAIFLNSCFTVAHQLAKGQIKEELIIAPDPDNPFQGTWIDPSKNYLQVINGMDGAWYVLDITSYKKNGVYTIKQNGDTYITNTNFIISVNGDILTIGNMTYERYIK
jgi:hypothetical protein